MKETPRRIALDEWDDRYAALVRAGLREPPYGGPLRRHVEDGDSRLENLKFDSSAAALRLWNFLLTEEDRLHQARSAGRKIVGTMKDLGTVPVMAYSLPNVTAFYPDGAWWLPCIEELNCRLLNTADSLGINESFCPVRAMLGAFMEGGHFPIPDLLICSAGATCDDFSAIAQRLNGLGHPILWWEIPHRREPDPGERGVDLPGGFRAPEDQVVFVRSELNRVKAALEDLCSAKLDDRALAEGIRQANRVRDVLRDIRRMVFTAASCPLPALELLIAEMFAIHFCSDRAEAYAVLTELLGEVGRRVRKGVGVLPADAVRLFWVNPVADLRVMNLLEDCGGRICGTEFLFCHALDRIPEGVPPMDALAQTALADPMAGSALDRADRICHDMIEFGAEGLIISRIPGASHCATEGALIGEIVKDRLEAPVQVIEVPPLSDSIRPTIRTRLEAVIEAATERRKHDFRGNRRRLTRHQGRVAGRRHA